MSLKILLSSETYSIDPNDLNCLEFNVDFGKERVRCNEEIVLLVGNSGKGEADILIRGGDVVKRAIDDDIKYVPVRIAFRSGLPRFASFLSAFKQVRKKCKYHSSNVYHMSAQEIRRMRIERAIRNKENAYGFRNPKWCQAENKRLPKYLRLVESIAQKGYDDAEPISIMVCRSFGVLDSLNQGHHRLSAALDAKVDRISVSFSAVSKPPVLIALLLLIPAKIKRAQLRRIHSKS